MTKADATIILGGGVREGGVLPPWSQARFDLAMELNTGEPFVCLSAATTHRPPPLDSRGFPITECAAGARYLIRHGIAPQRIRLEALSLDTIGNAWFCKLLHVDPAGWSRLLVITSEFHMPRTRAVFEWVYGLEPGRYQLSFAPSPNIGISEAGVRAREEKECRGIQSLGQIKAGIGSLRALHQWIFERHDAYSAAGRTAEPGPLDAATMESY